MLKTKIGIEITSLEEGHININRTMMESSNKPKKGVLKSDDEPEKK
jgi:hypothetical protein